MAIIVIYCLEDAFSPLLRLKAQLLHETFNAHNLDDLIVEDPRRRTNERGDECYKAGDYRIFPNLPSNSGFL